MIDLENQKTATQTAASKTNQAVSVEIQESILKVSPALDALEAKLLGKRIRAIPYTYRRPSYLQYIDYA